MSNLKFADTHNMVVFLSKPVESKGFEQIVDFLNAHPIRYALTVNPTIYLSCIKQFWSFAMAKTINREVQLNALVDGKRIVITETSIRRSLQLSNAEVSKSKTTAWNEFSSTMASAIICLATNQKELIRIDTEIPQSSGPTKHVAYEAVHKERGDSLVRATTTAYSLEAEHDSGSGPRCQETIGDNIAQTKFENVSTQSYDPLLARGNTLRSGEDSLKLTELMELCTNLQTKVLDLEKKKTTQANEIASLKRRVKKLEKKRSSRTHKLKRLYKVGLSARVESSRDEQSLGKDASKHVRINAIDADEDITLVSVHDMNMSADEEVGEEENYYYRKLSTPIGESSLNRSIHNIRAHSVEPLTHFRVREKKELKGDDLKWKGFTPLFRLLYGRTSTLSFMRPFGCRVTILNTIDHLGKFDGKADEDYILLPLWTVNPPFTQNPKSSHDDGSKPSSNDEKKVDEDPRKNSECKDQEKEDNVNSTNKVNAAGTNEVNAIGEKTSIELPFDSHMSALEDYNIFDSSRDDEDDGAEAVIIDY
ncbi:hypothetical protein Tco_0874334 [Tanacetum coccineum]|uniref:Xylulose kinase-1 n=1 Tax=Tanacetum coccineum TaxID=301880 RepID=A0ABQ5BPA6_9ASTR